MNDYISKWEKFKRILVKRNIYLFLKLICKLNIFLCMDFDNVNSDAYIYIFFFDKLIFINQ